MDYLTINILTKCFYKSLKKRFKKETSLFLPKFENFYLNVSKK